MIPSEPGPESFVNRVEVFYPEDQLRDDDMVVIVCPRVGGCVLRPEEKTMSTYRLLKGSTVRHGAKGTMVLLTPLWLWNAFLKRSAELVTGALVPPARPRKAHRHA